MQQLLKGVGLEQTWESRTIESVVRRLDEKGQWKQVVYGVHDRRVNTKDLFSFFKAVSILISADANG